MAAVGDCGSWESQCFERNPTIKVLYRLLGLRIPLAAQIQSTWSVSVRHETRCRFTGNSTGAVYTPHAVYSTEYEVPLKRGTPGMSQDRASSCKCIVDAQARSARGRFKTSHRLASAEYTVNDSFAHWLHVQPLACAGRSVSSSSAGGSGVSSEIVGEVRWDTVSSDCGYHRKRLSLRNRCFNMTTSDRKRPVVSGRTSFTPPQDLQTRRHADVRVCPTVIFRPSAWESTSTPDWSRRKCFTLTPEAYGVVWELVVPNAKYSWGLHRDAYRVQPTFYHWVHMP